MKTGKSSPSFAPPPPNPPFVFGHVQANNLARTYCRATGPDYGLQWLKDHNDACAAANKPCVLEELGVNRNNLDVETVMTQYQTYILSSEAEAIQGSMDWSSFYVDAACPDPSDPYAICASDPFYAQVVTDFAPSMAAKA